MRQGTNYCFVSLFQRIMLCAMCGDPYPVELIFGPLLHHQNCWRSPTRPDAIILETLVGYEKRRVMITLSSYHSKYIKAASLRSYNSGVCVGGGGRERRVMITLSFYHWQ